MSGQTRGWGKTSPAKVRSAEKRAEAMRLRVEGFSSAEIAERVGVHRGTVHRWITTGLAKLAEERDESTEQLRAVQNARLEGDIRKVREEAHQKGNLAAFRVLRGLYERQARLNGLDLLPEPGVAQVPTTIRIEMRTPQDRDEVIELPAETPDNAEFEVLEDEADEGGAGDD